MKKYFLGAGVFAVLLLVYFFVLNSSVLPSPALSGCSLPDRSTYSVSPVVFQNLPPVPFCFSTIVEAYHSHSFSDAYFFDKAFYLQPEFYPTFQEAGLPYWTNHPVGRIGLVGLGFYPATQKVFVSKNQSSQSRAFIHTSFGVRAFRSVRLSAQFENPADNEWATVSLDETSSTGFVLGPTYPIFDSSWARPVDISIQFSPDAPQKDYPVRISVVPFDDRSLIGPYPEGVMFYNAVEFTGKRDLARVVFFPAS